MCRPMEMGLFWFYETPKCITPNLDKLASKSSIFKSHFTGIVPCGPSRATMLTGFILLFIVQ
jgi:arylsulfatase A-like enzyme